MTNDPAIIPYIDTVLRWNDSLLGLPALPLVLLGCVVCGYMIKLTPFVPNRWIPVCVFAFGILANLGINPPTTFPLGVRAVILGMVAGGASIIVHRKLLRKWIDVNVFETGETKFINKPKEGE